MQHNGPFSIIPDGVFKKITDVYNGYFPASSQPSCQPDAFVPKKDDHIQRINMVIEKFKEKYTEYKKINSGYFIAYGLEAVTAVFYFPVLITLPLCAYTLYNHRQVSNEYHQVLDRAYTFYKWCAASGEAIANDQAFLDLTRTIKDFVTTEELLSVWKENQLTSLSDNFKKIILEKNPDYRFPVNKSKPNEAPEVKPQTDDFAHLRKSAQQLRNFAWFQFYGHKKQAAQLETSHPKLG